MNYITFSNENNFNKFKKTLIDIVQSKYNVTDYYDAENIVLDTIIKLTNYNRKFHRDSNSSEQIMITLNFTTLSYYRKGVRAGKFKRVKDKVTGKMIFIQVITEIQGSSLITGSDGEEFNLIESLRNEDTDGDKINIYDFDTYFTWKFLEKYYQKEYTEKKKISLNAKMKDLKVRKQIYDLLFKGYNGKETSEMLNISEERVSKILKEIIGLLKENKDLLF